MSAPRFTKIELRNWKNFKQADVPLSRRAFLVGPNASGKSNFLDVLRFLRDLVTEGGGLAKAVETRDGMSKLRSLYARGANSEVEVAAEVGNGCDIWRYELAFTHESAKRPRPMVVRERVIRREHESERVILSRPDDDDMRDPERRAQTALQQVTQNRDFRALYEFFRDIAYLHLVPHLVREGQPPPKGRVGPDPYGRDLLDHIRGTPKRSREARLRRIQSALALVSAPLSALDLTADPEGRPHLQVRFDHWRPQGAYQNEQQLSDGTLRLIGLLWALQERAGPLLLEEPELSLHSALVRRLAPFIHRAQQAGGGRQVLLSTHSMDLLMDSGIAPEEILLVKPGREGSEILPGAVLPTVRRLMISGVPASEAVLPLTHAEQLSLFDAVGP